MRILLSYILVILIWATTPLAIKWSGQGSGFLFGVTARMSIGALCLALLLIIFRQKLQWHRNALRTYFAVAVQIYGSMITVYWGAQFVPSGWISVIFGLTPLMTALFAAIWLNERSLTFGKILSYFMGIIGLATMFASAIQLHLEAVQGIMALLLATLLQSAGAVWIKRVNAHLPALMQVAGGLLMALPAYWLTWYFLEGEWPQEISATCLWSIVYLGVIATPIGFSLYYYLLTHLPATRVALINLLTPVMSLFVGYWVNDEQLTTKVAIGTLFILGALVLHEFNDRVKRMKLRQEK